MFIKHIARMLNGRSLETMLLFHMVMGLPGVSVSKLTMSLRLRVLFAAAVSGARVHLQILSSRMPMRFSAS